MSSVWFRLHRLSSVIAAFHYPIRQIAAPNLIFVLFYSFKFFKIENAINTLLGCEYFFEAASEHLSSSLLVTSLLPRNSNMATQNADAHYMINCDS